MEILLTLQGVFTLMIISVLFLFSISVFAYPSSRSRVETAISALLSSCYFVPAGLFLFLVVALSFHKGRFDFGEKHRRSLILGLCCFFLTPLFALFLLVMSGERGSEFIIFRYAPVMMVLFELAKLLFVFHLLKPRQRQLLLGLGLVFSFLLGLYLHGLTMLEPAESGDPVTALEQRLAYLSLLALYWIGIYELAYLKFIHDLRKRMKAGDLRPVPDLLTGPGARYYLRFVPLPAPIPGPSSHAPGPANPPALEPQLSVGDGTLDSSRGSREKTSPGSRTTDPQENQGSGKE